MFYVKEGDIRVCERLLLIVSQHFNGCCLFCWFCLNWKLPNIYSINLQIFICYFLVICSMHNIQGIHLASGFNRVLEHSCSICHFFTLQYWLSSFSSTTVFTIFQCPPHQCFKRNKVLVSINWQQTKGLLCKSLNIKKNILHDYVYICYECVFFVYFWWINMIEISILTINFIHIHI